MVRQRLSITWCDRDCQSGGAIEIVNDAIEIVSGAIEIVSGAIEIVSGATEIVRHVVR